jgi:hypothetical protein
MSLRRSFFGASPKAEKQKSQQQIQQDKRRSFAFLKYSPKTTSTSMGRTREHAKQIAMQMQHDAPSDYIPPQFNFDDEASQKSSFDLESVAPSPHAQQSNKLDMFVEREQRSSGRKKTTNTASSVISVDTSVSSASRSRAVRSMPTFPSNSTMLAKNVGVSQTYSTLDEVQMSPYALKHSKGSAGSAKSFGSTGADGSHGSAGKSNHLVNYALTPRAPITPSGAAPGTPGTPGGASTSNSTASGGSNNFLMEGVDHGFSFDAFGLDANVVDQEVSAAMRQLGGEWGDHEFPVQSFDSPHGSRSPSPPQDEDGFENGFRLTGISGLPLQVRQSPPGSDRSSLTSSTDKVGEEQPNYFKEQAGFHSTTTPTGREQARRRTPNQRQKQGFSDNGWATFGSSAFGKSSAFGEAFPPAYPQSEPGLASAPRTLPQMPQLDKSVLTSIPSQDADGFDVDHFTQFPPTPPRDFQSNASNASSGDVASDINLSDVGVSSDFTGGFGTDFDAAGPDIPMEVAGSKKKKSPRYGKSPEENKQEMMDDDPIAEWSVRSPVKTSGGVWGEDITPDEPVAQQKAEIPRQIQHSTTRNGVQSFGGLRQVAKNEAPEQQRRAMECANQRTSFESLKTRLKAPKTEVPKTYAQSDVGDTRVRGNAELFSVLNRVRNGASFDGDTRSDHGGGTPFTGVANLASQFDQQKQPEPSHDRYDEQYDEQYDEKYYEDGEYDEEYYDEDSYADEYYDEEEEAQQTLKPSMSYREKRELELRQQQQQEKVQQLEQEAVETKPKKMTYRECREMELRKEREEEARLQALQQAQKPLEVDVASLIRKRIAANKRAAMSGTNDNNATENFGNVKGRLKKVSIESKITQFRAPRVEESQPEFSVGDRKKSQSASFDESVAPTVSVTPSQSKGEEESRDHASMTSSGSGRAPEEPLPGPTPVRDAPSPMAAVHAAIASRASLSADKRVGDAPAIEPIPVEEEEEPTAEDNRNKLNAFLANRLVGGLSLTPASTKDDGAALMRNKQQQQVASAPAAVPVAATHAAAPEEAAPTAATENRPALKDDPKYNRYIRMLKVGMPIDVVKHAMTRDGVNPSVLDGDHNKPAGFGTGVPLKEDPKYDKYFKMLKIGLPMGAVQNAMERDGLDGSVMDGDHNLPAGGASSGGEEDGSARDANKPKDTHRRTRLHWDTLRKVRKNSLWAKIDQDEELEEIDIDEDEFAELFQAELTPVDTKKARSNGLNKKGAAVRVIDSKRANNGGIILARLKLTHDEMADAVDRIDHHVMSAEQMQNIIEYLPTSDERKSLEAYMLSGGTDAAEKFDGLCECEKFMVAMMTVKHAKRKVRALLFKLQFQSCLESLQNDTTTVEQACDELSNSVRLRQMLGIVLNVGNRLNTAGVSGKRKAGAFTLDSLLKLSQAKAFDKKTTFLHYIVLVVQRNNELLLRFKDDLPTMMKADRIYWDQVEQDLEEVENQLENVRRIALHQARLMTRYSLRKKKKAQATDDDDNSLSDSSMTLEDEVECLRATDIGIFTLGAIKKVSGLRDKVETTKTKFASLREYFGEEDKKDMQPHELFNIMVKFARDFEKAKEQVLENQKKKLREERKTKRSNSDPNLDKSGNIPPKNGGKQPPKRMNSAPVLLRASAHQPNMHTAVKGAPQKPPRNGAQDQRQPGPPPTQPSRDHAQPNGTRPPGGQDPRLVQGRRPPPSHGANGRRRPQRPGPRPQRPPPNGDNGTSRPPAPGPKGFNGRPTPPIHRPPTRPSSSVHPEDEMASSSTSMREKALQRRRHMNGRSPNSLETESTSISTFSSSARPVESAKSDTYSALGRRVGNNGRQQLSPRSNIRQRRRQEQRKHTQQPPPQELQWPEDLEEDAMENLDFALD